MTRFLSAVLLCLCFTFHAHSQSNWQKHESPISADLHNIFFVSDSVGWVTSHKTGAILHTRDGGQHWFVQAQMDSIYFEDIFFLDRQTGWVTAEHGLIFKTHNGGQTWTKEQIADTTSWIYSIHFTDNRNGIAVGLREQRPATLFLKTKDGGKSWQNIREKVPASFYEPISFLDDQKGYVAGLNKIVYTENAGASWEKLYDDTTSNSTCREAIRGLTMVTSNIGWAVGHCGLVLQTDDGKNWKKQKKFTENRLRSVRFINQSEGYVVGDSNKQPGVLFRTRDGGKTWQTAMKKAPDLHRITLTDNRIWLVGDEGTILSKPK